MKGRGAQGTGYGVPGTKRTAREGTGGHGRGKGKRKKSVGADARLERWGEPVDYRPVFAECLGDVGEIAAAIRRCTSCPLSSGRNRAVPGEGRGGGIILVGEAPGAKEDKEGRPFVGSAGKLLGKLLLERAGLSREEVFITNLVKCRPPKNRPPRPAEVNTCRPFIERQLELLEPSVVCPMGNSATKALVDSRARITDMHGRVVEKDGRRFMPLYHPAAILYNRKLMKEMEKDFEELGRLMEE
jgi:uracil-DNA glycosylase family 4